MDFDSSALSERYCFLSRNTVLRKVAPMARTWAHPLCLLQAGCATIPQSTEFATSLLAVARPTVVVLCFNILYFPSCWTSLVRYQMRPLHSGINRVLPERSVVASFILPRPLLSLSCQVQTLGEFSPWNCHSQLWKHFVMHRGLLTGSQSWIEMFHFVVPNPTHTALISMFG